MTEYSLAHIAAIETGLFDGTAHLVCHTAHTCVLVTHLGRGVRSLGTGYGTRTLRHHYDSRTASFMVTRLELGHYFIDVVGYLRDKAYLSTSGYGSVERYPAGMTSHHL